MRIRTVGDLRDSARRVLSHVQLEQVYAVNTSLKTHARFVEPPFRTDTNLQLRGEQDGSRVDVWARYSTDVFTDHGADDEGEPVWTVAVECVAAFESQLESVQFAPRDLEAFALLVGAPAIHPYAREWTQTVSGHSQYPAFTIGLLDSLAEFDEDYEVQLADSGDELDDGDST